MSPRRQGQPTAACQEQTEDRAQDRGICPFQGATDSHSCKSRGKSNAQNPEHRERVVVESPGWQVWGAKPKHNIPFPAEAPPALQGPAGCEEHEHLGTPAQLLLCTPLPAEAKPSHPLQRKSSKPFKAEPKASSAKPPSPRQRGCSVSEELFPARPDSGVRRIR